MTKAIVRYEHSVEVEIVDTVLESVIALVEIDPKLADKRWVFSYHERDGQPYHLEVGHGLLVEMLGGLPKVGLVRDLMFLLQPRGTTRLTTHDYGTYYQFKFDGDETLAIWMPERFGQQPLTGIKALN